VSIHSEHPFATPASERSLLRRLRGRVPSAVSVWTTATDEDEPGATSPVRPGSWAGLTVASFVVADGEPGAVLGLVDPESDLADLVATTGRVAVSLLAGSHREVADVHGGLAPSPGGPFRTGRWVGTAWGPVLSDARAWAAGRVVARSTRDVGWSRLLEVSIEHVQLADDDVAGDALVYRRGRYER
jgi:flavin reductase (DIM6/NTAB) family NADH-FMN oxidoreductase RutF